MNDYAQFDDKVWGRFFDFLYCDDNPTREEVQEHLRTFGIDVTPGLRRVQQAIKASSARAALEAARASRPSIIARMGQIIAPAVDHLREQLHSLITKKFEGSIQAAYFRKLEEAASENDLKSLLDDIERLETFSEDQ